MRVERVTNLWYKDKNFGEQFLILFNQQNHSSRFLPRAYDLVH